LAFRSDAASDLVLSLYGHAWMKIQGENSTAVPLAPEAVAEAAGWIISHYDSF